MNNDITAQELKTKGSQILSKKTKDNQEAFITVHGKKKYAVLTIEKYNSLLEMELETALKDTEKDIKAGKFKITTPEKHIKSLKNV
ncbi:prevent-host-death protein [Candidatus Peregrinibacteria bacterium]|nr:prevent-host-death protein [Candidatus Peregrinibacteria bacterium]